MYAPALNSTPLSGMKGSILPTAPVKGIVNKVVPVIEVFLKTIFPAEALLVPVIPLILVLPANTVPVSAPVPSIPA